MTLISAIREKIALRESLSAIFLVFNTFVWYVITYFVFKTIVNNLDLFETEKLFLFLAYFASIASSAILGSLFFSPARVKFLNIWVLIGVVATVLLINVPRNSLLPNLLVSLFLGVSIGLGLPSCLGYFADSARIEKRGFIGGIIWSGVGFTVLFLGFLTTGLELWKVIVMLAIWRSFGSVGFWFLTVKRVELPIQKVPKYLEILRKKELLLYLFPWIMFCIINFAEAPVLENVFGVEAFAFISFATYVFAGIFALVGGIIADIIGRKRVVIAGFVMLGVEYAALSVFYGSPFALYSFMVLDGVTWGLFFSVFFMSIWGDLGENHEKAKYYALGGLPFILAEGVSIIVKPYVSAISPTAAFSFASFFLFLAVVPLMYAPETLPEKTIRERELRNYIEKAKKAKEKYA